MPNEIRLWRITESDQLQEVPTGHLDLESRLEVWIEQDVSVLSDDLLIIARQLPTEYGGLIDLLCLDHAGDTVIVELKRGKTPREVTGQSLDYASWVRDLSNEDITRHADDYLSKRQNTSLAEAFSARFGLDLPDLLNGDHSILVVAAAIDPSSERIISYLSESYGVRINAVTFQYFHDSNGVEHLGRVYLLPPTVVEQRSSQRGALKRRPSPSLDEYREMAESQEVGELYDELLNGLQQHVRFYPMITLVSGYAHFGERQLAVFNVLPRESSAEKGLHYNIVPVESGSPAEPDPESVTKRLPANKMPWKYTSNSDKDGSGYAGYFETKMTCEPS